MDKSKFIGEKDYRTFAGGAWPTYQDFLNGVTASDPNIQTEINNFVELMKQSYYDMHPDLVSLAESNQNRQGQQFYNKQYIPNACRVPWNTLGINANGHAFICSSPSWVPKFIGNLLESQDIWTLLNSDVAQRIRQEIFHGRYYYCNSRLCAFFNKVESTKYNSDYVIDNEPMEFESRPEYQVTEIPANLIFDFDYTCNFKCPSCRTETINNNKHHVIRPINNRIVECIKTEIIDKIKYQPVSIRWCGGEPFISEPYLELLDYIVNSNKTNITHIIQTNGSYLKSKQDLLIKLLPYITELRISFDAATAETYSLVRVGGVWENLLDNVRWVRQYVNDHHLPVKINADFVVQQINYKEIPAFEELCKELGIDNISYQKMWNWGTWPNNTFQENNVYDKDHSEYPQLVDIFHSIGKGVIK